MSFHFGKPILTLMILSVASGAWIVFDRQPAPAEMTVWVRSEQHARMARLPDPSAGGLSLIEQYEKRSGRTGAVDLIAGRAADVRLMSMFMSGTATDLSPDLATVEISSVGKYFRPPVDQVGFVPLNDYLRESGWDQRIIASRLAPYTKQGQIFGVPFDVHPISITFRRDLFEQAGVRLDPADDLTWLEFRRLCLKFRNYWRPRGYRHRAAIELPAASADYLVVMLLQRGVNILDDNNRVHLTHPKVAETLAFYATCVAGPDRIGANSTPGPGQFIRDLENGDVGALITPDWRVDYIRNYNRDLAGKLGMIPLPRFDPTDARTATWGGTMIGIPRTCDDPDESWKLLEFLYLSDGAIAQRQRLTHILPPVIGHWNDAAYQKPDPLFGGQKVDALYVELAHEMPRRYVTPFTAMATAQLSAVLNRATAYVNERGSADGLERHCVAWLATAERDLKRRIEFGTFDP